MEENKSDKARHRPGENMERMYLIIHCHPELRKSLKIQPQENEHPGLKMDVSRKGDTTKIAAYR